MKKYRIKTACGIKETMSAKSIIDVVNKFYKDPNLSGNSIIESVTLVRETKKEKETPTLILKFGSIKGGDFSGNPEASDAWTNLHKLSESERKQKECEIIDLFNGDILIWWGQIKATKDQAKEYIMTYESQTRTFC